MATTLYQKLVETHTVARLDAQNVLLYADLHIMNEYTSPQAFAGLHEAGRGVAVSGQQMAVVDHIIPHKGDKVLFWDRSNWQPLCKTCHDTKTAREDGGFGRHG